MSLNCCESYSQCESDETDVDAPIPYVITRFGKYELLVERIATMQPECAREPALRALMALGRRELHTDEFDEVFGVAE